MIRLLIVVAVVLSVGSAGYAGSYPVLRDRSQYGSMPEEQLDASVQRIARFRNLRRRVLRHSAQMLGANYRPDPLGEGAGGAVDTDARFRLAPVDCVTFVEASLAMALAGSLDQAKVWMDRLRYSGDAVRFDQRNHFMLAKWLPHLKLNVLRDITRSIAEPTTLVHDYGACAGSSPRTCRSALTRWSVRRSGRASFARPRHARG